MEDAIFLFLEGFTWKLQSIMSCKGGGHSQMYSTQACAESGQQLMNWLVFYAGPRQGDSPYLQVTLKSHIRSLAGLGQGCSSALRYRVRVIFSSFWHEPPLYLEGLWRELVRQSLVKGLVSLILPGRVLNALLLKCDNHHRKHVYSACFVPGWF